MYIDEAGIAIRNPSAARVAKSWPCSYASRKRIGAATTGNAPIIPARRSPAHREMIVMAAMNVGTSASLSTSSVLKAGDPASRHDTVVYGAGVSASATMRSIMRPKMYACIGISAAQ